MITYIEQANLRKRVQIECAVWHLEEEEEEEEEEKKTI